MIRALLFVPLSFWMASCLLAGEEPTEDQIHWQDGGVLNARVLSIQSKEASVTVSHPEAKGPVPVGSDSIKNIIFYNKTPAPSPAGLDVLHLSGSDRLVGKLLAIDDQVFVVEPRGLGTLTLPRTQLKRIDLKRSERTEDYQPPTTDDWSSTPDKEHPGEEVKAEKGHITHLGPHSRIQKRLEKPEGHFGFSFVLSKSTALPLVDWTPDFFELRCGSTYLTISFALNEKGMLLTSVCTRSSKDDKGTVLPGIYRPVPGHQNTIQGGLVLDTETGRLALRINNQTVVLLQAPVDEPVRSIALATGKGAIKVDRLQSIPFQKSPILQTTEQDRVVLKGHQAVCGQIVSLSEGTLLCKTAHGDLRLPLKDIRSLEFKTEGKASGKVCTFYHNQRLTLTDLTLQGETLHGAMEKQSVTLPRQMLQRLYLGENRPQAGAKSGGQGDGLRHRRIGVHEEHLLQQEAIQRVIRR